LFFSTRRILGLTFFSRANSSHYECDLRTSYLHNSIVAVRVMSVMSCQEEYNTNIIQSPCIICYTESRFLAKTCVRPIPWPFFCVVSDYRSNLGRCEAIISQHSGASHSQIKLSHQQRQHQQRNYTQIWYSKRQERVVIFNDLACLYHF
jgi:hypothetical protein